MPTPDSKTWNERTSGRVISGHWRGDLASRTSLPSRTMLGQPGQTRTVSIPVGANTRTYCSVTNSPQFRQSVIREPVGARYFVLLLDSKSGPRVARPRRKQKAAEMGNCVGCSSSGLPSAGVGSPILCNTRWPRGTCALHKGVATEEGWPALLASLPEHLADRLSKQDSGTSSETAIPADTSFRHMSANRVIK
jgi:hypothetical protein